MKMIDSQQRRSRIRLRSGDDDVIEVEAGRNAVEGQRIITRLNLGSQSGRDLFLGAAQNILMEASVVQQNVSTSAMMRNNKMPPVQAATFFPRERGAGHCSGRRGS